MVRFSTPLSFSFLVSSCIRAIITSLSSLTVKAYWKWTTNKQQIIHRNVQDDHIKMTGSLRLFLLYYTGILGSLSDNDGDGYENVTWKAKWRCFKFYRAYFISFNSSNLGIFFPELSSKGWIEVHKKRRKSSPCVHVLPQNVKLGIFAS